MELILLALLPVVFLLVAAAMLVVSQFSGFLQFSRSSARQRKNDSIISRYVQQMGLARLNLARRSRELEALSRRLRLNNEELARLNTLKTKFLSMAVHDVRTPLASAQGFAQMLGQSQSLGPRERKFASNITRACDQIGRLMGDLTDLALIEAGKYKLEMTAFSVGELAADITPSVGFVAQARGVSLEVGEMPAETVLTADRFRLGRVLGNLLGNAVKFTPAGGRVELHARASDRWVTFFVKDTGPGIHPAERQKIFQKFYQSVYMKDAKARAAGWGLGLAIAEEIVRGHGGQIGVESPGLGKGSTFWVRVPLQPARKPRAPRSVVAAALAALLFLGAVPGSSRAQTIPLEEKAKYERALESRAEGVLLRVLGPNRFKVVVEAAVDFTRIEKFETKEGSVTVRSVKASAAYLWNAATPADSGPSSELLPGVPLQAPAATEVQPGAKPQSYERRNTYPTEFLKRLYVTLILDSSVDAKQSEDIRAIVTEILGITPIRGDELVIVHAPFAPAWKTIWYEPDTVWLVFKYGLIGLLSLMTLLVVAISLLKLSEAMREMAHAQSQQLTMDVKGGDGTLGSADGGLLEGETVKEGEPPQGRDALPGPGDEVRFAVRPDQVEILSDMLAKEEPENTAIIASHLDPDVRNQLLAALPAAVSDDVLVCLGRVRYVEPEMLLNLKEELERRLAGSVGGLGRLVAMLDEVELSRRSRFIETIAARDPELGRQLRRRVFMMENLAHLKPEEWSLVVTKISYQDWAVALADGPASVAASLLNSLPGNAAKVVEQMIAGKPGDAAARRAAQDKIAGVVSALVVEGRIAELSGRGEAPPPQVPEPVPTLAPKAPAVPDARSVVRIPPSRPLQPRRDEP
jgi:signal transduction histidine kinase